MQDDGLDDELIEYYSGQRMSNNRLEMLLEETRALKNRSDGFSEEDSDAGSVGESGTWQVKYSGRIKQALGKLLSAPRGMALASICLLAGVVWVSSSALIGSGSGSSSNSAVDLSRLMLREAAVNHQTKLQVDYDDSDVNVLAASMERLDFDLSLPEEITSSHTLMGGRYCTLGGNLAVHLRLKPDTPDSFKASSHATTNESGAERAVHHERSMFVTFATSELAALGDLSHVFPDNVAVSSWQQGDLFYVLAEGGQR